MKRTGEGNKLSLQAQRIFLSSLRTGQKYNLMQMKMMERDKGKSSKQMWKKKMNEKARHEV